MWVLIRAQPRAQQESSAVAHDVDERRLMAYAAGVRDPSPALFDLDRAAGIVAHPVFPVCLEWPLMRTGVIGLEFVGGDPAEGLHCGHEIRLRRPIRVGDQLSTQGRLLSVERKRSGVLAVVELVTVDGDGERVAETRQAIFYLGAELDGEITPAEEPVPAPLPEVAMQVIGSFSVELLDAVVYGECARIYNPVHVDIRRARAAGLADGPIIHGTATLARCVSLVAQELLDRDPSQIARVGCRLSGPVPMPSTLTVAAARRGDVIRFEAQTGRGSYALTDGLIELGASAVVG